MIQSVRAATEADVPAVVEVYTEAYAQPPWNEQIDRAAGEKYLRWVASVAGTQCLVSLDAAGAVAGFILGGPREYERFVEDWERLAERPPGGWPVVAGRLGYVWELAVRPAAQRRGHGSALLHVAIERLAQAGCETLLLRSSERATAAVALYRRFGFVRLPVQERYDPLAGPWILMLAGGRRTASAAGA